MRVNSIVILLCLLSVLGAGCVASQGDLNSIYARQTRLEAKMDMLTKQVQSMEGTKGTGADPALREQVYKLEQEVNALKSSYSDLNAKVNKPDFEMPESTEIGAGTEIETGSISTEEIVYNEGYTQLSEGNYEESREKFKLYLSKYPNSSKASDATYWIAESYYRQGEFEEAILDYQRFIDTYPSDNRVPLSYLKQGLSLMEIGKNEEAQLFFETLIDKYPQSDEANTAKEKIRELAVSG